MRSRDAAELAIHRLVLEWMEAEATADFNRADEVALLIAGVVKFTQQSSLPYDAPVSRSEGLAAMVLYVDLAMRFPIGRRLKTLEAVARVIDSDDLTYRLAIKSSRVTAVMQSISESAEGAEEYLVELLNRVGSGRELGDRAMIEWSYARLLSRLGRPKEAIVVATKALVEFGRLSPDDFHLPQAATHLMLAEFRSQLGQDPVPDLITSLHALERSLNAFWDTANNPIAGIEYLATMLEKFGQMEAAQVAHRLLKVASSSGLG